jgi:hypothetical protein
VRPDNSVALVADDYAAASDEWPGESPCRFHRWLAESDGRQSAPLPDEELMLTLLAELAPGATRRDAAWVVPLPAGTELTIDLAPGAALVTATLADLDDAPPAAIEAIAEFLVRALSGLRFVRAELSEKRASLAARAEADGLAFDLPHAVHAVSFASRLLVHEVQALADVDLAATYLDFLKQEPHLNRQRKLSSP